MPELPEVETIKNYLSLKLKAKIIKNIKAKVFYWPTLKIKGKKNNQP